MVVNVRDAPRGITGSGEARVLLPLDNPVMAEAPAHGVELSISGPFVVVTLHGLLRAFGFRSDLTIPLRAVTGASVEPRSNVLRAIPWARMPGSYLPPFLVAGTFGWTKPRQFWAIRRGQSLLVLSVVLPDYNKLVLQVPDPETKAAMITAATLK